VVAFTPILGHLGNVGLYEFLLICFDWPDSGYMQAISNIAKKVGLNQMDRNEQVVYFDARRRH
jgi:hypothetical protein